MNQRPCSGRLATASSMDQLKAMHAFVRIVEATSFSRTAETLALPRAAPAETMKQLEASNA